MEEQLAQRSNLDSQLSSDLGMSGIKGGHCFGSREVSDSIQGQGMCGDNGGSGRWPLPLNSIKDKILKGDTSLGDHCVVPPTTQTHHL